jgi:hypothetical protein
MSDTGNETYHRGTANGNSRIGVLFKNFYFGLIKIEDNEPSFRSALGDLGLFKEP